MTTQKNWALKGTVYESCRVEGHCPLWFGRDLWGEPCVNLMAFHIKEGQVQNVDMKDVIILRHQDGIGPKYADFRKSIKEVALYINDNVTKEQREVLEPFVTNHMGAEKAERILGVKVVRINIDEKNGTYHITMPFGELKLSLTVGRDGTPIRLENPWQTYLNNIKFCNNEFWNYHDYGKNLEFRGTCGVIADFAFQGEQS
jgi:hypothetical protein